MRKRIDEKELSRLVSEHNKKTKSLIDDVFETDTTLVTVLKFHYAVEFLIDKIFESVLEKPSILSKKSFSEKVRLFEAMSLDNNDEQFKKQIWGLNEIRNKFAHNPRFNLWSKEGHQILKNTGVKAKNSQERFLKLCDGLVGYLRTMWSFHEIFPFMTTIMIRTKNPEKDLWFRNVVGVEEINREIKKFVKNRSISKIITKAD